MTTKAKREPKVQPNPAPTLYKVLLNGRSFHGGDLKWSLPKGKKPGAWHAVKGDIELCCRGLHVTKTPTAWWAEGAECFEVETSGKTVDDGGDKVACQRVRLVRKLSAADLAEVQIFTAGEHVVKAGVAIAYGSATVRACGSATVRACGSATVTACGSATVTAYDSATVTAYDSTTVMACGSATVTAYDSATVTAYGSATVTACGSATVTSMYGNPSVTLEHYAVLIDRRDEKPKVTVATK